MPSLSGIPVPSCHPRPPLLGPHCSPGISQDWPPAPPFPPGSHMVSSGQDPVSLIRHPTAPPLLFRAHRFDPSLLPVWVMSLFLDNLGELWGQTGHKPGNVVALWGAVGGGAALSHPGPGSGPGQAVSAWVWEQGRIFIFHFPPTESTGRELAVCPWAGRLRGAMSSFPLPRDPWSCGLGAQLCPDITRLLPTLLPGVLAQALHPQTPTPAPQRVPGLPQGAAGLEGKCGAEGEGSCREEEPPHSGGDVALPISPPHPPHLKHPPDLQNEQPSCLPSHSFGTPLHFLLPCPSQLLALRHSPALHRSQWVPPNPVVLPKASLPCPCPSHALAPPLLPPGMAAAWLVAEIGHLPAAAGGPFLPAALLAGRAARHPGQGCGRLWVPGSGCGGSGCPVLGGAASGAPAGADAPVLLLLPALQRVSRAAMRTPRGARQLLVPEVGCKVPPDC